MPRLAVIEILSYLRGKLLIAGRINEKVPRPVFRRFARAAPRAHFTHPRFPNRNCLPNERTERNPKTILSLNLFQQANPNLKNVQTLDAQSENVRNYSVLQRNMIPAYKQAAEKEATRMTKWRRKEVRKSCRS